MKKKLAPAIAAVLTALIIAAIASAQSVGHGIKKDTTLAGTGSSGSPLGVNTTTLAGSGLDKTSTTLLVGQGSGLTVTADAVSINPTYTQRRVTGTCGAGSAVTAIAEAGTVTCGAAGAVDGDYGDITVSSTGTVWTVDSNAVAYSELSGAFATNNVIPKGNGTTLTASSLTDDGTTLTTAAVYQKTLAAAGGVILRAPSVAEVSTGMYSMGIVDADWTTYFDKTLQLGYNYQGAVRQNAGEPAVFLQFESKYDAGSGYQTETHLSSVSTGGTEKRHYSNSSAWDGSFVNTDLTSSTLRFVDLSDDVQMQLDNTSGYRIYRNAEIRPPNATIENGLKILTAFSGVAGDFNGQLITSTSTFDATAAARSNSGLTIINSSARSAGAFDVTSYGLVVDVDGSQNDIAIYTADGDNYFNATSGFSAFTRDTFLGSTTAHTTSLTGSLLMVSPGAGATPFSMTVGANTWGARLAGGSSELFQLGTTGGTISTYYIGPSGISGTGELQITTSKVTTPVALSAGADGFEVTSGGQTFAGDTANSSIANNVDVVTIGNTGTAHTTSGIKLLKVDGQDVVFDLATSKTLYGAYIDVGAPTVGGCGAPCTAQGGLTTNIALYSTADDGDFNYSGYFDAGTFYVGGTAWLFGPAVSITGNLGVGDDVATDTLTVNASTTFANGPAGINTYDGTHFEWADDMLYRSIGASEQAGIFFASIAAGTITADAGGAGRPGVVQISTSTSASGLVSMSTSYAAMDANGNTSTTFEWVGGFPTLSTAIEEYSATIGFFDGSAIDFVDGCAFLYDRGASQATPGTGDSDVTGDRWKIISAENSTRSGYDLDGTATEDGFTGVNSPVAALTWPSTNVYRLKVVIENDDKCRFYINNVEVGRITTNVPGGTTRLIGAGFQLRKSVGTTARTMDTDFAVLKYDLTAAR